MAKFKKHFGSHVNFVPSQSEDSVFTILHYAGRVMYSAQGIVDKNRDKCVSHRLSVLFVWAVVVGMMFVALPTIFCPCHP